MAAYPLLPTVNLMAWFPAAWAGNVASTLVSVYEVMVAGSPPITRVVPAGWLAPNPVPSNTKVPPPTKDTSEKMRHIHDFIMRQSETWNQRKFPILVM